MGAYGGANIGWPTSVNEPPPIPYQSLLIWNYPNPFNPTTTIMIVGADVAEIEIYDISGRWVERLTTECGRVVWDARGQAAGLYFASPVIDSSERTERDMRAAKLIHLK
jgi:hypothetical protein